MEKNASKAEIDMIEDNNVNISGCETANETANLTSCFYENKRNAQNLCSAEQLLETSFNHRAV